jgi:hypothetical protein
LRETGFAPTGQADGSRNARPVSPRIATAPSATSPPPLVRAYTADRRIPRATRAAEGELRARPREPDHPSAQRRPPITRENKPDSVVARTGVEGIQSRADTRSEQENKVKPITLEEPPSASATGLATRFADGLHPRHVARMLRRAARVAYNGELVRAAAIVDQVLARR